jgi:hypothetical protein
MFCEGSSATGGTAKRQGRLFFGSFLWSEQRNEQTKVLKDYFAPLLCMSKEGVQIYN